MSTIKINGMIISGDLSNVVVQNGRVIVNGRDETPENEKEISIVVEGDCPSLSVDACRSVQIGGSAGDVKTLSGDVRCDGTVSGGVSTMSGDIIQNNNFKERGNFYEQKTGEEKKRG